MLDLVKKYLLDIVDKIDAGNSTMTEEEANHLIDVLKRYTDSEQRMSKYQSCKYLGISRSTFDSLVKEGKIPRGIKVQGFKELSWTKKQLDDYISQYGKK